jgi:hypothetical protein
LLQSSFYKSKKYLNAGMLGKDGLRKLKLKIAARGDANQQLLRNIYASGPRQHLNFKNHVTKVLDLMEDSLAATRCEQLLTHKLVYEMPT